MYLIALGAGLLVGLIYGLLNVRSPAPPVVALVGLLGILLGEQGVPLAKRLSTDRVTQAVREQAANPVMGILPSCARPTSPGSDTHG